MNAILGELSATKGTCQVTGKLAYCPQEPFILPASLRNNILCGLEYNEDRYNQVIQVCALNPDIERMPQRDLTLVGDRGVCLSGGQKARLSLARALYVDADIYLLDDPLSAVDSRVARHLYENAICGLLKGKIRILATHQVHFLCEADQIAIMEKALILRLFLIAILLFSSDTHV